MGWHAQPTAQVDLRGRPGARRRDARRRRRRGHRLRHRDERAQRRPDQHRRVLAGRRPGRLRQGRGLPAPTGRRSAARCSTSRPSGSRSPIWPPRWRHREPCCGGRHPRSMQPPRQGRAVRDGQALRHRRLLRRRRPGPAAARRLRLSAASTDWRRSSAICGCTESSREPTKSCAWSSVGPRPARARASA